MKQFGKFVALCAVVAMTVVLLGQDANATTQYLYWQKQTTGKAAYWKLNTNGKLHNRTRDQGWNWVDNDSIGTAWRADLIQTGISSAADQGGTIHMLYHNTNNGKVAYWVLNTNGELRNRTQGEGWDWVTDQTMSTDWSMKQIMTPDQIAGTSDGSGNDGMSRLLWFRASNGKVAYWNLNSNGALMDRTRDAGWGYIDDDQTLTDWRFIKAIDNPTGTNFGQ